MSVIAGVFGTDTATQPFIRYFSVTTAAELPTTGYGLTTGDLAYAADTDSIYAWDGAAWDQFVPLSATGVAGQVAIFTGINDIGGDAGFTYDSTANKVSITDSSAAITPLEELFQASTGDVGTRYTLSGAVSYMQGIDNTDDKYKISYGATGNAALGTNDFLTIGTNGEVIVPQWFQVGTATDAAAQGDFVAGLVSSHHLFYDQSTKTLENVSETGNVFYDCVCRDTTAGTSPYVTFTRRNTSNSVTPDGANIGTMRFQGLTTTPGFYIGAEMIAVGGTNTANGFPCSVTWKTNAGGGAGLVNALVLNSDQSVQVPAWLEVGTATDAATAGDFATGLTGAARFFYDQSVAYIRCYDSAGAVSLQLSQVAATESVFNEGQLDIDHRFEGDSISHLLFLDATATTENIAVFAAAAPNWQTMDRGFFVGDTTTAPTGNPASGGFLYSNAGAGTWRGSGGTVTAFGPAGPHCGECGYDFWRVASHNDNWGASLRECGWCGKVYKSGPKKVLDRLTPEQRAELIYA